MHITLPSQPIFRAIALALFIAIAMLARSAEPDPQLEASRAITDRFAADLQAALTATIAAGGPVAAITVCRDLAPQIASRLSRETGAKVGRTSLRLRNPANAPEPWQAVVLQQFDAAPAGSAPAEHFERFGDNGARYLRAISVGGLCLACHGTDLADDVRQQLDADYPHDRARGYRPGDVRGAFSVVWPDLE